MMLNSEIKFTDKWYYFRKKSFNKGVFYHNPMKSLKIVFIIIGVATYWIPFLLYWVPIKMTGHTDPSGAAELHFFYEVPAITFFCIGIAASLYQDRNLQLKSIIGFLCGWTAEVAGALAFPAIFPFHQMLPFEGIIFFIISFVPSWLGFKACEVFQGLR